ncbi:hypothetical protein UY3_09008 [Chelonia mydas]|uniref:Uncharacterized protein n=1 Tax=Chelonia mydas TaxID=8469 RepID=M7BDP4_CHEMY|nr:hypothetical protein UY3_09008 [Chelonia mydas]
MLVSFRETSVFDDENSHPRKHQNGISSATCPMPRNAMEQLRGRLLLLKTVNSANSTLTDADKPLSVDTVRSTEDASIDLAATVWGDGVTTPMEKFLLSAQAASTLGAVQV